MADERETAIRILSKARGHKLTLVQLGNRLAQKRALGFGVEVEDIVFVLKSRGLVNYDTNRGMVTLATLQAGGKR